jgi:hypothetical protein
MNSEAESQGTGNMFYPKNKPQSNMSQFDQTGMSKPTKKEVEQEKITEDWGF